MPDTISSSNSVVDTDFTQIDPRVEFQNYLKEYADTIVIDTSIIYKGEILHVAFEHYCTYDSSINLPIKYIKIYGLTKFVTHSFDSKLKITMDKKLIVDTIISKTLFYNKIPKEEQLYGVLFFSKISFFDGRLKIDYSISIPLTDVGQRSTLECSYDGKIAL